MKPDAPRSVRAGIALAVVATVALLSSCSDEPSGPAGIASVTVTPESATLGVGGTVQLSATIRDANGNVLNGRPITWKSDNAAAATVDQNGLVTGVAAGSAAVSARSEGLSDHAAITVRTTPSSSLSVSAGGGKTCSLTASGAAYCWGYGPLGDGSTNSSTVPVAVTGGLTFSAVTAGNFTACGITTAAAPYCWGEQGGSVPAAVPGGHEFIAMTIGDGFGPGHYCGLTANGTAYCWGNNFYGQVGDGTRGGDQIQNGWPVRSAPVAVAGGLRFAALTAGLFHTCGLTTSGAAYCWGAGGQLGDGSTATYSSVPVAVAGGLTFVNLSAGGYGTCGLTTTGAAYCWGFNAAGSLGDGSITPSSVPVAVSGGLTFSAVSTGGSHACGLTANGAAYCWGYNVYGQLGTGDNTGPEQCDIHFGACSKKPIAVTGGLKFAVLSAGAHTTCGVTLSGTAYCWGDNGSGQLGNGTTISSSEPVQVVGFGAPPPVASVTMTPDSATMAPGGSVQLSATTRDANGLLLLGRPMSWTSGNVAVATVDANGLVTGVATGSATVIATSEGRSDTATITVGTIALGSLSAGSGHTCGLTTRGAAYCWGSNATGQLGNGSTANSSGPVAVSGGLTFSALVAGSAPGGPTETGHSCGLTSAGAAYCWGDNGVAGQLGHGGTTTWSATPVAVSGGLSFTALAIGGWHTCGLATSGAAFCWGSNISGELGNGTTTWSTTPVAVSGGLTFRALAAGDGHTCGLATSGAAFCWGSNGNGELGNGSTTSSSVPVAVTGGLEFSEITTGGFHTCALTSAGAAYCWGLNDYGQLGTGSTTSSSAPVLVSGGLSFSALATGASRANSCGLTRSGAAYCWGVNATGQLGNGSTANSSIPVAVSGGQTFSALTTGSPLGATEAGHSCGLTSSGAAYCWGDNGAGQLGDGTTTNRTIPAKVVGQP